MLARVLQDSDPFGADHPLILETLAALSTMRDERAVPQIAALARKKRWLVVGQDHATPTRLPAGARQDRDGQGETGHRRPREDRRLLPEAAGEGGRDGMSAPFEDLIRRLGATVRAAELYAPTHPLVQRTALGLQGVLAPLLEGSPAVIVGFLEDDVVVNDLRLARGSANMAGLLRDMRDRKVEKITFGRGLETTDIRALMDELADRTARTAVGDRLTARGIRRIVVSKVAAEDTDDQEVGLVAAKQMYSQAVTSAETIWAATKAGDQPNPAEARGIIDSLSRLVYQDRTSLLALTTLKRHDNYTFTHMVNVAALSMAMARSLDLEGPMLREFGFAALMHDIGKVHTPLEILEQARQADRRRVQDHEAARRRRRARAAAHAGDAGARAGGRVRASPQDRI